MPGLGQDLALEIDNQDVQAWSEGTIRDWLPESHGLAKTMAYAELPERPACGCFPTAVEFLPETYVDHAKLVVLEQLKKAGIRLATVLNEALK